MVITTIGVNNVKKYNLVGKISYVLGLLFFLVGFLVCINKINYFVLVPSLSVAVKYQIISFLLILMTESKIFKVREER